MDSRLIKSQKLINIKIKVSISFKRLTNLETGNSIIS